jgi:hypothetical protein
MPRGRRLETLEDYKRSIKNGFGQGKGSEYKPWLRVQDVSSKGLSSKINGIKSDREHHTLSKLETQFFYLAEFSDSVIDIREQFPLLPLTLSNKIAKNLNIPHPKVPKTNELNVMTTDALLTLKSHKGITYTAVCVKPRSELENERVAEKIDIERAWWQLLGIPFKIFTGNRKTEIQAQNIAWATDPLRHNIHIDQTLENTAFNSLSTGSYLISDLITQLSSLTSLNNIESMNLLQILIAKKKIIIDLNSPILKSESIQIISLKESMETTKYA